MATTVPFGTLRVATALHHCSNCVWMIEVGEQFFECTFTNPGTGEQHTSRRHRCCPILGPAERILKLFHQQKLIQAAA